MRKTFVDTLSELARKDETVCLCVMDVGFSFIEDFEKEFPKQFYNFGVTEQSSMGIVAGMALAGLKPYLYSMIPFVTMRNFEQLRNDVCYHNANVTIIGVRGSKHYKFLGFSHNPEPEEEDLLLIGHLPNISTYWPETKEKVREELLESYKRGRPAYMRI